MNKIAGTSQDWARFAAHPFSDLQQLREKNPSARYCPVCDKVSETFRRGGVGKGRPNAKCPNCGALERHRLLWLHLMHRVWLQLPDWKKDILHVAPEKFLIENLKPRADVNYLSGDLMMSDSMARLDLTDIQFWDEQFDLVICSHVLEHIPNDRKAMREMRRILRPGGFLLVMVPMYGENTYEDFSITTPEGRLEHFGQEDHVRKYGRDIVDRLSESGFDAGIWPGEGNIDPALIDFIASKNRLIVECRAG